MISGYQVVLDACVLVNAALRDTLLRLAEPPHRYGFSVRNTRNPQTA